MFFRRNLGKNDLLSKSFCIFAGAIRYGEQIFIETTKRYARLANGNVGNFQMNCKDGVSVRAYSVGWLLLLSSRQFSQPPSEEVANQRHASTYY